MKRKNNSSNRSRGFTMVELLLSVIVGSIVLAATYASYLIVARQFTRVNSFSEVQSMGIPTMNRIVRDLRMAGYRALDENLEAPLGAIEDPIEIDDSGSGCCDELFIVYDQDLDTRIQIRYFTAARANPVRTALYMEVNEWDGADWVTLTPSSLVADYVADFQAEIAETAASGKPRIVDISMIFSSRDPQNVPQDYTKPDYNAGNFAFATDSTNRYFYHDDFSATVFLRNVQN